MAEIELAQYSKAIAESFPELAEHTIAFLANGKDHVACLVNGEIVFRFPKRAEAEAKLHMEIRLLPELAPTLPLPIPQFSYVASAPKAYPYGFVGYHILAGKPLTNYMPEIWDATWWPPEVGAFLTALHNFPAKRAQELGVASCSVEEWRGRFQRLYDEVQERVYPLVNNVQHAGIKRYFEGYLDDPAHFRFKPVLLHGDFYSQHILLDTARQQVTGIIDFSDCVIGDPAFDIRNAWEPYYRGEAMGDDSWRERRDFYYRLQPLLDLVLSDGTAGMEEVNPNIRAESLEHLNESWPPEGGH